MEKFLTAAEAKVRTECSINNLILQEMDELHSKIQKAIEENRRKRRIFY